jgi:hypothetical protein
MKFTPILLSTLAFLATVSEFLTHKAVEAVAMNTKGLPQDETTSFMVYLLPSLIGFIASLAPPMATQAAGIIMILSGVAASIMLTNTMIAFAVGSLYIIGGIILLTNTRKQ